MKRDEIEAILRFINEHPESYASLAVCRRALDPGLPFVTRDTLGELEEYLYDAPDDEIESYYSIIM